MDACSQSVSTSSNAIFVMEICLSCRVHVFFLNDSALVAHCSKNSSLRIKPDSTELLHK